MEGWESTALTLTLSLSLSLSHPPPLTCTQIQTLHAQMSHGNTGEKIRRGQWSRYFKCFLSLSLNTGPERERLQEGKPTLHASLA